MERIGSIVEFWPYYLGEHRNPRDRALHFVGTSWFFLTTATCFVRGPMVFPAAFVVGAALTWFGSSRLEARRPAFAPMVGMLLVGGLADPWFLAGVAGAYACAWCGHFLIEGNRPATFRYPVWSFLCDFRMWSHMARGRLWSGDSLGPAATEPR